MSLKAFHLVFVAALSALTFGCVVLFIKSYRDSGDKNDLVTAGAALLAGIVVLIYGKYFFKKLKNVSYL